MCRRGEGVYASPRHRWRRVLDGRKTRGVEEEKNEERED